MSRPRLIVQFEALFEYYQGMDTGVQLEEITEILDCTRRNARIVLNKMEQHGWIEWLPAAGRGKLSQLNFKASHADVSEHLARRYVQEGNIVQALQTLDQDRSKFAKLIESHLGFGSQQGQQFVRLPYYRPLTTLHPRLSVDRSELHIVQQIFNGLTYIDSNEQLKADLAHDWQMITPKYWRFYLRPSVRFHNDERLSSTVIADNLLDLQQSELFSHILKVSTPNSLIVDIELSRDDFQLPLLLADSCAKIILPAQQHADDCARLPIGTGPYRVVENNDKILILEAFDDYFGFRPLLDKVEIWVMDNLYLPLMSQTLSKQKRVNHTNQVELDVGCSYLLLNRKDGLAASNQWANYFIHRLSSLNLFQQLPQEKIVELGILPAFGLKAGWYHHTQHGYTSPPSYRSVTIACQEQHPMFVSLIKGVESLLKEDGLSVRLVNDALALDDDLQIDIWFKPMQITTHREDALAAWLFNRSGIEAASCDQDFQNWTDMIKQWQATQNVVFPSQNLAKSLVEKMQLIPLFHSWLTRNDYGHELQNVKFNGLGWFDFSKVWVMPNESILPESVTSKAMFDRVNH